MYNETFVRTIEQILERTAESLALSEFAMSPEEARSFGCFEETALSEEDKEEVFRNFSMNQFENKCRMGE